MLIFKITKSMFTDRITTKCLIEFFLQISLTWNLQRHVGKEN